MGWGSEALHGKHFFKYEGGVNKNLKKGIMETCRDREQSPFSFCLCILGKTKCFIEVSYLKCYSATLSSKMLLEELAGSSCWFPMV